MKTHAMNHLTRILAILWLLPCIFALSTTHHVLASEPFPELPNTPTIIKWSPDGVYIAVGTGEFPCDWDRRENFSTYVIDVVRLEIVSTLTDNWCPVNVLHWSADSTKLAIGSGDAVGVRVWDVPSGQLITTLQNENGLQGGVSDVSWRFDGTSIAFATPSNGSVLMNPETGAIIDRLPGGTTVAWSPDGNLLFGASAYDGRGYIFDTDTQELVSDILELQITGGVAWSPDGTKIYATTSEDFVNYQLTIWDSATFEQLLQIDAHEAPILGTLWSSDGDQIFTGAQDNFIRRWDVVTGQLTAEYHYAGQLRGFDVSPDGTVVVIGDIEGIEFIEFASDEASSYP
ncbi:MAG: hypothetical protein RLP44_01315 [Aggregatilineales bacterium]